MEKIKINVYLRSLNSHWPVHRFAEWKRGKKRDIKKERISIHGYKT